MARLSSLLLLFTSALLVEQAVATETKHAPVAGDGHLRRRDLLTCEQTYGSGWTPCGAADSTFCYNPSEGQTCCPEDAGYCDAGAYCAPVAGFCCLYSEDFGTCADNSGFQLPSGVSSTWTTTWTRTTTVTIPRSRTSTTSSLQMTPNSHGNITRTLTSTSTTCLLDATMTASNLWGGSGFNSSSNSNTGITALPSMSIPYVQGTGVPYVQASAARRQPWMSTRMAWAMGAIAVFMAIC
ncbi:hypothetical protein DL546_004007 [Coniochaeta pulveracea]|uniref:Uncharacterized protein n=1 Tax=Coniochaeta pulveracea TaxID=177199 RepID=A0A420Y4A9_9PEZI|nr:hypothetical protein DL546_004007 [Coniochaeta pulveracea]